VLSFVLMVWLDEFAAILNVSTSTWFLRLAMLIDSQRRRRRITRRERLLQHLIDFGFTHAIACLLTFFELSYLH
jgi:hypothetical protein